MTEPIRIEPEVWTAIARRHDDAADIIARSRLAGNAIADALRTYGPIMHRTKAAATDVLRLRDQQLHNHDNRHRDAAHALRRASARFIDAEDLNTKRLDLD